MCEQLILSDELGELATHLKDLLAALLPLTRRNIKLVSQHLLKFLRLLGHHLKAMTGVPLSHLKFALQQVLLLGL